MRNIRLEPMALIIYDNIKGGAEALSRRKDVGGIEDIVPPTLFGMFSPIKEVKAQISMSLAEEYTKWARKVIEDKIMEFLTAVAGGDIEQLKREFEEAKSQLETCVNVQKNKILNRDNDSIQCNQYQSIELGYGNGRTTLSTSFNSEYVDNSTKEIDDILQHLVMALSGLANECRMALKYREELSKDVEGLLYNFLKFETEREDTVKVLCEAYAGIVKFRNAKTKGDIRKAEINMKKLLEENPLFALQDGYLLDRGAFTKSLAANKDVNSNTLMQFIALMRLSSDMGLNDKEHRWLCPKLYCEKDKALDFVRRAINYIKQTNDKITYPHACAHVYIWIKESVLFSGLDHALESFVEFLNNKVCLQHDQIKVDSFRTVVSKMAVDESKSQALDVVLISANFSKL